MKIGIISHYYQNRNYGGNLQAYALCNVIKNMGYQAEQIDFLGKSFYLSEDLGAKKETFTFCSFIKEKRAAFHIWLYNIINSKRRAVYVAHKERIKCIDVFNREIPHSNIIYTKKNVKNALQEYSIFITGSDQVWNPIWYKSAYFLDFVSEGIPKIAYAASISQSDLTEYQKKIFKEHLKSFLGVSVREESSVELLSDLYRGKIEWVLDPTLLLSREDWDVICEPRRIKQPYVFCYFLGDDLKEREAAKEFARLRDYQIVTLPHLFGQYRSCDDSFGNELLYDVSPADFISLIKNADYIFTDSFHACVFSEIYQKQYFSFERIGAKGMGNRIESLTKIFGHQERFLNTAEKTSLNYFNHLEDIDYSLEFTFFAKMKDCSLNFLRQYLKMAEKTINES